MARNNDLGMGNALTTRLIAWASVIFLFAPLPILIFYSFNAGRNVTHWEGFSLKWYAVALADRSIWLGVRNSLIIAMSSTTIATILGTAAALVIAKYSFRGKLLFQNLIYVPIMLPEIIFGLAILALFVVMRMPLGFVAVICAHVTFSMSFVALIVLARLQQFDSRLEEASLDLGANRRQTFVYVVLPVIAPGIISGAMFAFTLSIDDFITTLFTAGANSTTLPLKIYSMIKYGVTPTLNAVSTLLIAATIIALVAAYYLQTRQLSRKMLVAIASTGTGLIAVVLLVSVGMTANREVLNIYNYAYYIDDAVLADFEAETGIRINYSFYNSNEELLNRLALGAVDYDLIFPSDYMVSVMVNMGLLAPINRDNIPNLTNLDPRFRSLSFDPDGTYHVAYTFGASGISYNQQVISEPVDSWHALLDEARKGRILMFDDMRECFAFAFRILGFSIQDKDPQQLQQAKDLLLRQKPLLLRYDSNTVEELLLSGSVHIAQAWSGLGVRLSQNHPQFAFVLPREGVPMFVDAFCVPRNAKNQKNAEAFINYMLRPEVAARNMVALAYAMPNCAARAMLPDDLRELLQPLYDLELEKFDFIGDLGDFTMAVDRAWTELRSARK